MANRFLAMTAIPVLSNFIAYFSGDFLTFALKVFLSLPHTKIFRIFLVSEAVIWVRACFFLCCFAISDQLTISLIFKLC